MQAVFVTLRTELITVIISWYILYKAWPLRKDSQNLKRFCRYAAASSIFAVVNLLSSAEDERLAFFTRPSGFAVNFFYMMLICWGSYTWFRYEESVLKSTWMDTNRRKMFWRLPFLIFLILCLLSWKTGWVFDVDAAGCYHRGSLWELQFIFSYFYMLIAVVKAFRALLSRKWGDSSERRAYTALIVNSFIVLIGCILQICFGHGHIAIAATIGLVVSYIELCSKEEQEILEHQATQELLAETKRQKEELQVALDKYKQADYERRTDFLTGLWNRQDMFELLRDSLSGKRNSITAMYMMDLDNFKNLNDMYGHSYGDTCLKKVGSALKEYGRDHEMIFYRYGGEEMIGIGFGPKESAPRRADELVALVSSLKIVRSDTKEGVVTASVGYTTNNHRYEKMVDMADAAMYRAKGNGKNQAVCYESMLKSKSFGPNIV